MSTVQSAEPTAFTLLTLPDIVLTTPFSSLTGTLALECVSLPPQGASAAAPDETKAFTSPMRESSAVYLVLKLGDVEIPVDPAQQVSLNIAADGMRTYNFSATELDGSGTSAQAGLGDEKNTNAVRLAIPPSTLARPQVVEDVETFDHVLTQYANFTWTSEDTQQLSQGTDIPSREPQETDIDDDLRGRLVLMDEASGEVVAELPEDLHVTEDPGLAREDALREAGKAPSPGESARRADPVVLELPPEVYDAYTGQAGAPEAGRDAGGALKDTRELFVRAIPPEEQDWITKSASLISYAIDTSTSLLVSGISAASSYYIAHSTPASASGSPSPQDTSMSSGQTTTSTAPRGPAILTSPRTHTALAHAHNLSGQAARASARTAAYVEGLLRRAMAGRATQTASGPTSSNVAAMPAKEGTPTEIDSLSVVDNPPPYTPYVPGAARAAGASGPSDEKADLTVKPALPSRRAPPLPPRHAMSPSPQPPGAHLNPKSGTPNVAATDAAGPAEKFGPRTRRRERALLSLELVLASADDAMQRLFDVGSARLGEVMGHKYGPAAAHTTHLATHTARNVVLVYIDMRGFARRALVRKAGAEFVKSRVKGKGTSRSSTPVPGGNTGTSTGGTSEKNRIGK
ncbi:hypothetical protein CERSUDRAFT_97628 [Gelatoporia subvermispora B]|uniref:Senescence domain-containing protein n=1 Tax=Ceriporiopsis subvermispora (strain B) TaxID=914234 RepID=M2R7I5_CERS8|nr:hypothetical protein CERSUDRAFT_97628 [Gelatoporia subvermispora B]